MERKQLEDIGLEKDIIDKVIALHQNEIQPMKAELEIKKTEVEALTLSEAETKTKIVEVTTSEKRQKNPWISVLLVLVSCGGLLLGSNILVEGAGNIAKGLGVSERIISITVIAFGTSIPELATSIIAAFKKQIEIGLGNIIGSNIFNILVIAGISSLVTPLQVNPSTMNFDIYFLLGFVVLTGLFFLPLRKPQITRWKGFVYLLAYFGYYVVLFYN